MASVRHLMHRLRNTLVHRYYQQKKLMFTAIEIKNEDVEQAEPRAKAATSVSTITKPQLRGLLNSAIKRNLTNAILASAFAGFMFKKFVADVRKRKYAEFYRTYDAEKDFEEMRKKGHFQSC